MTSRVAALARSTHPGPGIAVTVVAVVLGVAVGLEPWRVALLGVAVLLNQASVGLSNDWIDADRDRAVGRTDKPVALGLISAGAVRTAALIALALAIIATLPLGWPAALVHALFIASAWCYNAGLKNTPISVLPYIVSFGILPLVVTLSRPVPVVAAPWTLGLGALLGVAAHFANVLPDLDDDRRTGVSGLPHRLGRIPSGIVICVALAGGGALSLAGGLSPLHWIGFALTLLLAGAIAALLRRPPTRLLFQLIIAAALVNVVVLAFSGGDLLA